MSRPSQSYVRNCLLSALSADAYAALQPHLESAQFERSDVLIEGNAPIRHVHFLDRGIGSIITSTSAGGQVETGLFGREGMSGVAVVLGADHMPQVTVVQVAGDGYRVETGALRQAIATAPVLLETLLPYVQTLITQTSYTAYSNVNQSVEERLARWLLMSHDRVDGDDLPLTHEFLAIMLAVRRPSVTTALHVLEGNRLIKARRGHLTILDRDALIEFADGSYGASEAEYDRLIGGFR
jgi:CRP-like cAMP-binding protein